MMIRVIVRNEETQVQFSLNLSFANKNKGLKTYPEAPEMAD